LSGCIEHQAIDITGRACPCAEGWICDEGTMQCFRSTLMRPDSGARDAAAGGADAEGTDAGEVDAGSGGESRIYLEAESGMVGTDFLTMADAAASGGMYITVMAGLAAGTAADEDQGYVRFEFTSAAGDHKVWGRALVPDGEGDSFWARMDGGTWVQWNGINATALGAWEWDDVHDSAAMAAVQTYTLTAGAHTFDIAYREDGAQLDRVLITSETAFVPTGTGD
jgi:hypothetical protein